MSSYKAQTETSQSIIDGTIAVMAKSGLNHLTTKLVSQQANVSTASIHYFFDTKERLIHESFAHVMNEMWERLIEVSEQDQDPLRSLRKIMDTFFETNRNGIDAKTIWPQLWHYAGTNDETGTLFRDYNMRVKNLLEAKLVDAGLNAIRAKLYAHKLNALHRGLWIELHVDTTMKTSDTDQVYTSIFKIISAEIMGENHE